MNDRQSMHPPPVSRRFTTLEGWNKIGEGVYAFGQKTLVYNFADQFDLERANNDKTFVAPRNENEWDSGWNESYQSKSASKENLTYDGVRLSTQPEKPYHVYTSDQKWIVVALISAAGLFSGLSSNIYFPSLDIIAKVELPVCNKTPDERWLTNFRNYMSQLKMSILQSPHISLSKEYLRYFGAHFLIASVEDLSTYTLSWSTSLPTLSSASLRISPCSYFSEPSKPQDPPRQSALEMESSRTLLHPQKEVAS
jgi:hypothetical protein